MARIEDYALIGDLQTAALVERGGSIDWLCFPRFDSGACFAALLGDPDNGRWLLAPAAGGTTSRSYRGETLVLETIWENDEGAVRVYDFMPPRGKAPDVVRIVEGIRGKVEIVRMFSPRVCGGARKQRPSGPATATRALSMRRTQGRIAP